MRNELVLPWSCLRVILRRRPPKKMDLFEHFWHLSLNQNLVTWSLPIYPLYGWTAENSRSLLELTENTEESFGYIHPLLNEHKLTFSPQIIQHFEYSWNKINSTNSKKVNEVYFPNSECLTMHLTTLPRFTDLTKWEPWSTSLTKMGGPPKFPVGVRIDYMEEFCSLNWKNFKSWTSRYFQLPP